MARRGLDVVLISRSKAKLDNVAADIGEASVAGILAEIARSPPAALVS